MEDYILIIELTLAGERTFVRLRADSAIYVNGKLFLESLPNGSCDMKSISVGGIELFLRKRNSDGSTIYKICSNEHFNSQAIVNKELFKTSSQPTGIAIGQSDATSKRSMPKPPKVLNIKIKKNKDSSFSFKPITDDKNDSYKNSMISHRRINNDSYEIVTIAYKAYSITGFILDGNNFHFLELPSTQKVRISDGKEVMFEGYIKEKKEYLQVDLNYD